MRTTATPNNHGVRNEREDDLLCDDSGQRDAIAGDGVDGWCVPLWPVPAQRRGQQ